MSRTSSQMRHQLGDAQSNVPQSNVAKYYFAYSFQLVGVASGATLTTNTQINADADFLVQAMTWIAYDLTGNQVVGPDVGMATLQITESNGVTFYDQPQPIQSVCGSGELPFILPESRLLLKNNSLSAAVKNVYYANALSFYITMHGKKLFNMNT